MNFYTYIIYSASINRYYTGSCSDLKKRLQRHNDGATPSTKPGRPWVIYWFEEFENKSDAIKRENQIKRMKSRQYIESLGGNSDG
ncbi:MAG: GIY-YIG nuclease family protein [Bacteroidales bacterium]|nr:GIY-YIG nuclease family protein [Bacteroidales bacterium]